MKLNIFHLLRYLREELLLIFGTSTAEPALPGLMRKMEHAGVEKSTVGLVVPTGYSFNLDGAAIYLSLAALYIAQATNTDLTIPQQLGLIGIMLLTSKGAAGVAGGGFIALTATLSTVGTIPAAGIMLVFGIDKFMSECRALVNFCGNAVATLFIARWDKTLDVDRARRVLRGRRRTRPLHEIDEVTHAHVNVRSAAHPSAARRAPAPSDGRAGPGRPVPERRTRDTGFAIPPLAVRLLTCGSSSPRTSSRAP